ncbi:unnamed protein product [Closterium sp. NIES-64]|nr:unnamed protein product [Closterium sp. NIES-64]
MARAPSLHAYVFVRQLSLRHWPVQSDLDDVSPACPVPDFTGLGGEIRLLRLQELSGFPAGAASGRPLLVYLPGMDGTGQCLQPQIKSLTRAGFDIRALYIPMSDRSTWRQLVRRVAPLIQQAANEEDAEERGASGDRRGREAAREGAREVTVLAESFGACLALRIAAANPGLLHRLVLVSEMPFLLRCLPFLLRCLPFLLRCLPFLLRCLPFLLRCLPHAFW